MKKVEKGHCRNCGHTLWTAPVYWGREIIHWAVRAARSEAMAAGADEVAYCVCPGCGRPAYALAPWTR